MATRVNVMKLLQEVRGFAQLTNRRPQPRPPGPALLQAHWLSRRGPGKDKRVLRIKIDNPPDIPHPVKIHHVKARNGALAQALKPARAGEQEESSILAAKNATRTD